MMNRHARLMTQMDQLKVEHGQLKFVAEQSIRNAATVASRLQSELDNLEVTKDECEKELQMKGNLMHEVFHIRYTAAEAVELGILCSRSAALLVNK